MLCKDNVKISNIPDIYFNLDESKMVLFRNDMFRLVEINGERKYVCKIILDSRYNYWNIGEPVIKKRNLDLGSKALGDSNITQLCVTSSLSQSLHLLAEREGVSPL